LPFFDIRMSLHGLIEPTIATTRSRRRLGIIELGRADVIAIRSALGSSIATNTKTWPVALLCRSEILYSHGRRYLPQFHTQYRRGIEARRCVFESAFVKTFLVAWVLTRVGYGRGRAAADRKSLGVMVERMVRMSVCGMQPASDGVIGITAVNAERPPDSSRRPRTSVLSVHDEPSGRARALDLPGHWRPTLDPAHAPGTADRRIASSCRSSRRSPR